MAPFVASPGPQPARIDDRSPASQGPRRQPGESGGPTLRHRAPSDRPGRGLVVRSRCWRGTSRN